MENNKQLIRLTEADLYKMIGKAVCQTFANLTEGIYPNGQQDMFMNQDETDVYTEDADSHMMHALYDAEKRCQWSHAEDEQISPNVVRFKCYPDSKMACGPQKFAQAVMDKFPFPDNIECKMTRRGGVNVYMTHYDGPMN